MKHRSQLELSNLSRVPMLRGSLGGITDAFPIMLNFLNYLKLVISVQRCIRNRIMKLHNLTNIN